MVNERMTSETIHLKYENWFNKAGEGTAQKGREVHGESLKM